MESIRLDEEAVLKTVGCNRLWGSSPQLSALFEKETQMLDNIIDFVDTLAAIVCIIIIIALFLTLTFLTLGLFPFGYLLGRWIYHGYTGKEFLE